MKAKALKTNTGLRFPSSPTPGPGKKGSKGTQGHIFRSNLNNKFKLTPFNSKLNDLGEVRYLPPVSKE